MFVGALTLSPIADIFGRRPVHIAGLVLSLIGGLWMYVFPTWFSVIISLVFKGVGMYSRLSISYLYTLEMFDEERCVLVATIIMSVNNALSSIMALYFMFGGRDATFFLLCSIFIVMYSLIFVPILPESPKLLYSQKKYEETRE
jgi:MFS family permease